MEGRLSRQDERFHISLIYQIQLRKTFARKKVTFATPSRIFRGATSTNTDGHRILNSLQGPLERLPHPNKCVFIILGDVALISSLFMERLTLDAKPRGEPNERATSGVAAPLRSDHSVILAFVRSAAFLLGLCIMHPSE